MSNCQLPPNPFSGEHHDDTDEDIDEVPGLITSSTPSNPKDTHHKGDIPRMKALFPLPGAKATGQTTTTEDDRYDLRRTNIQSTEFKHGMEGEVQEYFDETHVITRTYDSSVGDSQQKISINFQVYSTYPVVCKEAAQHGYKSLIDPISKKPFQPLIYFIHHGAGETACSSVFLIKSLRAQIEKVFEKYCKLGSSSMSSSENLHGFDTAGNPIVLMDANNMREKTRDDELNSLTNDNHEQLPPCYIVTFDCRAHGCTEMFTETASGSQEILWDEESMLHINSLCDDFIHVVKTELDRIIEHYETSCLAHISNEEKTGFTLKPNLVLVGHSMGGSVVVKSCNLIWKELLTPKRQFNIVGVVPLDIVEGTAIESIPQMKHFVATKLPKSFKDISIAENFALENSLIASRLGVDPCLRPQLRPAILLHRDELKYVPESVRSRSKLVENLVSPRDILSDFYPNISDKLRPRLNMRGQDNASETDLVLLMGRSGDTAVGASIHRYMWRTDVSKTEPFWEEWFSGLSEDFLKVRASRLLILAGTDRLDTPLLVGQMQGKYQLEVLKEAGHAIMESEPDNVATFLREFYVRNKPLTIIKRFPIPAPPKKK